MSIRRLIVSDLHFGSGDDLLSTAAALERIEPELQWADELVVNGDLFELVFAALPEAVAAARPFMALVNRHVARVHYIPGNHDHHLVALARDEDRLCQMLDPATPPRAGVAPAARLLGALCPDVEVIASYPLCELDGIVLTHGHYIAAHAHSTEWRLMDSLAWHLTGAAGRPQGLAIEDYEALITPLYELMYAVANLPSGRRAQQRFERWLDGAAAIAHAPQHASHRFAALVNAARHHGREHGLAGAPDAPTAHVLEAMQAVCENLAIAPGPVVFGHTHVALDGVPTPDGRHRLFNSGSWIWDHRLRDSGAGAEQRRPGTVLRATGAQLELRSLLADCDGAELARMSGLRSARKNDAARDAHGRMKPRNGRLAVPATAGGRRDDR